LTPEELARFLQKYRQVSLGLVFWAIEVYWNKKKGLLIDDDVEVVGGLVIYLDWSTLNMRTCSVSTSKHAEIVGKWWLMGDGLCVTLPVYWE
jgi:hypothetical protein